MTREVHWTKAAKTGIKAIVRYIAVYDVRAAANLREKIERAVQEAANPHIHYKEGRADGTHEIVVSANYVVVFRETPKRIYVVNVVHTRQQYP
jgi:toxin ParE1/3/4